MGDNAAIKQAIKDFAEALGTKPKWVIVLTPKGRFIGRYGEYEDDIERSAKELTLDMFGNRVTDIPRLASLDDEKVAKITFEYASAVQKFNEQLKAERDTFAIALDGNYIIWFTFRYTVGINFVGVPIASLDTMLDKIYQRVVILHDAIWDIDGYHEGD